MARPAVRFVGLARNSLMRWLPRGVDVVLVGRRGSRFRLKRQLSTNLHTSILLLRYCRHGALEARAKRWASEPFHRWPFPGSPARRRIRR